MLVLIFVVALICNQRKASWVGFSGKVLSIDAYETNCNAGRREPRRLLRCPTSHVLRYQHFATPFWDTTLRNPGTGMN